MENSFLDSQSLKQLRVEVCNADGRERFKTDFVLIKHSFEDCIQRQPRDNESLNLWIQILHNFAVGDRENQIFLWKGINPNSIMVIWDFSPTDPLELKLIANTASLTLQLLQSKESLQQWLNEPSWTKISQSFFQIISKLPNNSDNEANQNAFKRMVSIISHILDMVPQLWAKYCQNIEETSLRVSLVSLTVSLLLKQYGEEMELMIPPDPLLSNSPSSVPTLSIDQDTVVFWHEWFSQEWSYWWSKLEKEKPTDEKDILLFWEAISCCIEMENLIATWVYSTVDKNPSSSIFHTLKLEGIFPLIVGGLKVLPNYPLTKHNQQQKDLIQNPFAQCVHGVKKTLIQMISNLVLYSPVLQDLSRETGLIPIVMSQCMFDGNNPYIREWSIFALRNLCHNNKLNQKIIEDLKLQNVESDPELLHQLGIDAKVENGKLKISQVKF